MRAFVALELPDSLTGRLARLQDALPAGRPVPVENLHLTLAFLGEQPEAALADLGAGLSAIAAPALELRLTGLGTFGAKRPRVLLAEAAPDPALADLRDAVRRAARYAGIDLARERFRPHVTLARLPPRMSAEEQHRLAVFMASHAVMPGMEARIDSFALIRSTLRPDGAIHDPIARYRLG